MAELAPGDPRRARLRDRLIEGYLPVARHIAARFAGRGQEYEDLEQVAVIGLIGAVDRFQPERGNDFLSFAVPTITGHVRRYFRDFTWSVRVPRALKELYLEVSQAVTELSQHLGQAPTVSELAAHLQLTREQVLDGLQAAELYRADCLDRLVGDEQGAASVGEMFAEVDAGFAEFEHRDALQPLLAALPERERTILMLRFYGNLTQTQIAQRIGISQMHVSRLLTRTLQQLREQLSDPPETPVATPNGRPGKRGSGSDRRRDRPGVCPWQVGERHR